MSLYMTVLPLLLIVLPPADLLYNSGAARKQWATKKPLRKVYVTTPAPEVCHDLPKLVCTDVEVPSVEHDVVTDCETLYTEQCVTVEDKVFDTEFVEECQDVHVGFRVELSREERICIDYVDDFCRSVVDTEPETITTTECNPVCREECEAVTRTECGPVTRTELTTEYTRQCTEVLMEQCRTDNSTQTGNNYQERGCQAGRKICEKVPVERCSPDVPHQVEHQVTDCQCYQTEETKCSPWTEVVCKDVASTEYKEVVREECEQMARTLCEVQDLTSGQMEPDDSCAGLDGVDPECLTVSQQVCFQKEVQQERRVPREECFQLPCESCHDRLEERPTVRVESNCVQENFHFCMPAPPKPTAEPQEEY